MKIAVLALQGAFAEHEKALSALGAEYIELRQKSDLSLSFDGLILPGGESTVQGKLLRDLEMLEPLQKQILEGLPVLGTCAGLILLAKKLVNDPKVHLGTLPVTVLRNAYGRQLGSFYTVENILDIGEIPMKFIRAPYITSAEKGVKILAKTDGKTVAVRYENQLGLAFHPELCPDLRLHRYFLNMVKNV